MKSFKKLIAASTLVAILTSTIAFAANSPLDNATANVTLDGTAATETLTVNVTKDFSADNVNYVEIRDNTDTSVYTGAIVTSNNVDSFTIDSDFDAEGMNTSTRYTISFETVSGDYGSAVLVVNDDNRLTVTAQVQPILKFGMESTNLDFGTLTTNYKQVTTGLEVGTNAVNGLSITAETTNGGLASTQANHTINLSSNDGLYSAEDYQFLSTLGTADSTADATINNVVATTMNTTNQVVTVYTADKPQNFDTATDYDVDFTVQTKIAESTPSATDYTDVIIFTATANF